MSIRGLVTVVIGVVAFVVIDNLVSATVITGTDTGSMLIKNLIRIVVAAAILIGVVKGVGASAGKGE